LDYISTIFNKRIFYIAISKGVEKFHSKEFGCNNWLDLLTVDVLNGFYCIGKYFVTMTKGYFCKF